jgi:hypothetical protein
LNCEEESNYKELCLFYSLVYVKFWFLAPIAADAPKNDLDLFKRLQAYKSINPALSNVGLAKLRNHFWYVSPELMVLSLFSKKVKIRGNEILNLNITYIFLKVTIREKRKVQTELLKYGPGDWRDREVKLPPSTDLSRT